MAEDSSLFPLDSAGHFKHSNTSPPPLPSSSDPFSHRILPLFSNAGKTAILSGAGSGIGLNVAHALAESGAAIAIWYNHNKKAIERAADIERLYGVKCRAYQVNVLDPQAVQDAIDSIVKEFNGRLDIFVANSGVTWEQGSMADGDLQKQVEHYRKVATTDLDGVFYCARAAAQHWKRQKETGKDLNGKELGGRYVGGSFVATASMSAHIVNVPQMQAAYNAAKAGVVHLCRSLSVEWVRFARANSVSPGYTLTEISNFVPEEMRRTWKDKVPMGRECEPHELKGAYLYLASDASSYTTGIDICVDGGYCAT